MLNLRSHPYWRTILQDRNLSSLRRLILNSNSINDDAIDIFIRVDCPEIMHLLLSILLV